MNVYVWSENEKRIQELCQELGECLYQQSQVKTFNNLEVVLGTSYNSLHEVFVIVYNDIVSEEKRLPTDHFDVKMDRGDSDE